MKFRDTHGADLRTVMEELIIFFMFFKISII